MSSVLQYERANLGSYMRDVGRNEEINNAYNIINRIDKNLYHRKQQ